MLFFMAGVFFVPIHSKAQTGPQIGIEQYIIDYGTIDYDSEGERIWTFKNTGDAPLLITAVKGSCGCTVVKYPKTAILPGKEASMKVKYDTKRAGIISKTFSITTNEPADRNFHVIKVMGTVKENPNPKKKK